MAHYDGRTPHAYVPDSYPPPGAYQQQPAVYYQPQYSPPRPRRQHFFLVSIVRPWAIVVSFIIVVMNIWWFSTGRICGYSASVTDKCYWVLWNSLPLAIASMAWNFATTLSHRRIMSFRSGIPLRTQLPIQFLLAAGAAVSLGLLSWSFTQPSENVWSWNMASHGGMIALVAIVTLVNWLLVGFIAYEGWLDSRHQEQTESYAL
ncbi:unnamed protein product [Clonostachys rosea]|uniref:MARVEL domain-containing protein n=1 Tax=Bionectria ochroleuca TaxID=29856 RepID=A0ABY6U068_BIOOC|nr:unnamed protein product [Clonostachys rosea]